MLASRFLAQVAVSFVFVLSANAESHVIKFINQSVFFFDLFEPCLTCLDVVMDR